MLLTVEEVAGRLRSSRSTAYEMIASGEIPSVRIRRLRREWAARKGAADHASD